MNQGLMITILIARAELQMAVQKQPDVVLESGQHDMLVTSIAGKNDLIRVDIVFRCRSDSLSLGKSNSKGAKDDHAGRTQSSRGRKLFREKKSAPESHPDVYQSKQHRGPDQAEPGDQQNRKQQRCSQSPQVIEG